MRLRLELFVKSVEESRDFYTRVLGFEEVSSTPDGYSVFRKGSVQIALQAQSELPDHHPLKPQNQERVGLGVEIVIEVDDVDTAYRRVVEQEWLVADPLAVRPWGTRDFRLIDPNGYYIRVNENMD
jgi:catechol 2,3-dioxygenase-like lactoylglutathione lyase family enzyme